MLVTESPNYVWTRRWVPLFPHFAQMRLWRSPSRYKVVTAGRRSGKTELAKRKLVEQLVWATGRGMSSRFLAAAPTKGQAEGIFFADLVELLDADWVRCVRGSDLHIETVSGASISVVGLDEPSRIEGIGWTGAVVDEIADCPPGAWTKHLMPALAGEDAWAWIIGVPDDEGRNRWEQDRLIELAKGDGGGDFGGRVWSHHSWSAEEILSPEVVRIFRGAMDERTYAQEIHGEKRARTWAAFEAFRREVHVGRCEYRAELPLCWSLDFNVNPMCSGILQVEGGGTGREVAAGSRMRVLCELTERHSDTMRACDLFERTVRERGWDATGVCILGDATGNARDTTSGIDDWSIVRSRLAGYRPVFCVGRSNPTQRGSVNAVRGMLRSADGEAKLRIDPSCAGLIREMQEAQWPGELDGYHHLAWLRYAAAWQATPRVSWGVGGVVGVDRGW